MGPSSKGMKLLYPEYRDYLKPLYFAVYDKREIAAEKIRAILTRRGIKTRDFIDLYILHKKFGIEPESIETCAVEKTELALKLYAKYNPTSAKGQNPG